MIDYSDYKHIVKRGKFELYIPNYLQIDKQLNKRADLQYADSANTVFMLLIREEIPDLEEVSIVITSEEYFEFAKAGIMQAMEKSDDDDDTITVINGNVALSSELTGDFGGQEVYYRLTIISDEIYFYQIIFWTVKQLKGKYEDDFYASTISFQPL